MNDYRIVRWNRSHPPNSSDLRQILEAENYSVFQWSDQPQTIYSLHKHSDDQSHWIISGELELTIENVGTFILKPGDRDFMPAHTLHSARVTGKNPVVYLIGAKIK